MCPVEYEMGSGLADMIAIGHWGGVVRVGRVAACWCVRESGKGGEGGVRVVSDE